MSVVTNLFRDCLGYRRKTSSTFPEPFAIKLKDKDIQKPPESLTYQRKTGFNKPEFARIIDTTPRANVSAKMVSVLQLCEFIKGNEIKVENIENNQVDQNDLEFIFKAITDGETSDLSVKQGYSFFFQQVNFSQVLAFYSVYVCIIGSEPENVDDINHFIEYYFNPKKKFTIRGYMAANYFSKIKDRDVTSVHSQGGQKYDLIKVREAWDGNTTVKDISNYLEYQAGPSYSFKLDNLKTALSLDKGKGLSPDLQKTQSRLPEIFHSAFGTNQDCDFKNKTRQRNGYIHELQKFVVELIKNEKYPENELYSLIKEVFFNNSYIRESTDKWVVELKKVLINIIITVPEKIRDYATKLPGIIVIIEDALFNHENYQKLADTPQSNAFYAALTNQTIFDKIPLTEHLIERVFRVDYSSDEKYLNEISQYQHKIQKYTLAKIQIEKSFSTKNLNEIAFDKSSLRIQDNEFCGLIIHFILKKGIKKAFIPSVFNKDEFISHIKEMYPIENYLSIKFSYDSAIQIIKNQIETYHVELNTSDPANGNIIITIGNEKYKLPYMSESESAIEPISVIELQ